jgi:hypothetical protein
MDSQRSEKVMKIRFVFRFLSGALLTALPLLNGCTQQTASGSTVYTTTTTSAPVTVAAQPLPAAANEPVTAVPESAAFVPENIVVSNAPAAEIPTELTTPPNVRVSKALGEVIRLTQAGVEETVVLTYVTNSPAAFLLGAEEIVYLKDLGVESSVITAMMHRDQTLRAAWGASAETQAAVVPVTNNESEAVAAAPTYVSPPASTTVVATQPVYVNDDYFYDSLSPYGTWVEVDGYGRCWRPTVVVTRPHWRPYCDNGRWMNTDAGWYWMSDYSWGSVAFHYGRWFSHPRWGWCWWPDRVWAPSWVSWRYDNDNCGWAPLPPNSIYTPGVGFTYFGRSVGTSFDFHLGVGAFTFVPWNRFCDPYPYRHCLPQPRSVVVFNRATVVNNFERDRNVGVAINRGIPVERVREHSRTEVRTAKIRNEAIRGANPRVERLEGGGRTLVVHRPEAIKDGAPSGRDANRVRGPRNEASVKTESRQTPPPAVVQNPALETPRKSEPRRESRPAPIIVKGSSDAALTPVASVPVRTEPNSAPVRKEREATPARSRDNTPALVRTAEPAAPVTVTPTPVPVAPAVTPSPTPVTRPTPIFSKPLVVETRPQNSARPVQTAPSVQTVPRSENRSSRIAGRDYSVWSSPTPRRESSPSSAPSYNSPPVQNAPVVRSAPRVETSPTTRSAEVSRPSAPSRSEGFSGRSQQVDRGSRSEVRSAPAPVVVPRASAPPMVTPAPAPVRPVYTQPAAPTPSAPRVETRSAPSRVETTDSNRGNRR